MEYPFTKTWWIDNGRILGGQYPGGLDVEVQKQMLAVLLEHGITQFVNLQQPSETGEGKPFRDYMPLIEPLAAERGVRVGLRRFPIADQRVPDAQAMRAILDHIDEVLEMGEKPYVHCWGGNGRTGTVVGCWLVRHGRTAEQAFREMEQGRVMRGFRFPAPETSAQREFVSNWLQHDRTLTGRDEVSASRTGLAPSSKQVAQKQPRDWFEKLTGVAESHPDAVRSSISVDGIWMTSTANGRMMVCGRLETPTLAELRERVHHIRIVQGKIRLQQQVADVQQLHADRDNTGALFQVASQFNLLEMVEPSVRPEQGVGRYENDPTQGPACAIAAGAGTIYRNYFASVNGATGQTRDNQIDCLANIGKVLGNDGERLWKMQNGYALPSVDGLEQINAQLIAMDDEGIESLRSRLRIGIQWDTQVTLKECSHCVSQIYCSAVPISYSGLPKDKWERFARLALEGAYEATICTAILNAQRTGNKTVFLTFLGGGAFGNETSWILEAMERAMKRYVNHSLDVVVVSYNGWNHEVDELAQRLQVTPSGKPNPRGAREASQDPARSAERLG